MSVRLLTHRLLGHGRAIVHHCCRRAIHNINILERRSGGSSSASAAAVESRRAAVAHVHRAGRLPHINASSTAVAGAQATAPAAFTSGLFRLGQQARRLFVDSLLNRISVAPTSLRVDATRKLLYGDSAPFLSLIGVSLATGGILTRDDELEGVCWEIREAVARRQGNWCRETVSQAMTVDFGLADLDIGPPIAKGCAAVVYAAAMKPPQPEQRTATPTAGDDGRPATPTTPTTDHNASPLMSPIQNTSRFVHNFGGSVDNVHYQPAPSRSAIIVDEFRRRSMATVGQQQQQQQQQQQTTPKRPRCASIDESEYERAFGGQQQQQPHDRRAATAAAAAAAAEVDATTTTSIASRATAAAACAASGDDEPAAADGGADLVRYPFALKMMFNYDIQSNAMAILRAMYKETIPARNKRIDRDADAWETIFRQQTVSLPPHPNIVLMFGVFCDQIPNLAAGSALYPMALPPRINPHGYGRNMSLFLLMKRYNHRLCDYLADRADTLGWRTRILIFAQLLEAVAHLHRYGVAHRDLKSDNILIDLNDDVHPVVVLADFGCCLADRRHGLQLPYTSADIDKGGNAALMAPEIIGQRPGTFSVLDYRKADVWTCGALAYEVFGRPNPFYATADGGAGDQLRNSTYADADLPALPEAVPPLVRALVANVLQRQPRRRLRPDVAANVMQLFLWAPSAWLRPAGNPSSAEILQWLLSLTTKVLCEERAGGGKGWATTGDGGAAASDAFGYRMGRRTYTEYLLISSFLVRARLETVRSAMSWIQGVVSY